MPTRTFDTQQLIDWELDTLEECQHIVHIGLPIVGLPIVGKSDYTMEVVFRAPDDGRLWSINPEFSNPAGYSSITGIPMRGIDEPKSDRPVHVGHEVEAKTRTITYYQRVTEPELDADSITMEMLQDMLGLVMTPEELPSRDVLEPLTQPEREEVADWVGGCHFEASDNDCTAGPMPAILRDKLPEGHTLQDVESRLMGALPVKRTSGTGLYIVRHYDGFDHEWIDVSKGLPWEEALTLWRSKTEEGTKNTCYGDIDYYNIFPSDTKMLHSTQD